MSIVTLISDWGLTDYYVGAVKGKLLSLMPDLTIVDISHTVHPFDIEQTAYILKHSFPHFPDGTIHIIGVNDIASKSTPHIVVEFKKHFFICADNGIMNIIIGKEHPDNIIDVDFNQDSDLYNFPTKDLFLKLAVHIAQGKPLADLGHEKSALSCLVQISEPVIDHKLIKGRVIHVDNYSNVITNISRDLFKSIQKGRKFVIDPCPGYEIHHLSDSYLDVDANMLVAFFNDNDLLEIAINQSNLSSLLSIFEGKSNVNIYFID